jgi:hypothetical protein
VDTVYPHPACYPEPRLLAECELERLRRSGPGGQRRNKVETGVRLRHRPTGLVGEATERRSAAQNHAAALQRLRFLLAIEVRSPALAERSNLWRQRFRGGRISVNADHADAPALVAEALDVLAAADWNHQAAAEQLGLSATQLVRLLAVEPRALARLNTARVERGLKPLRI